jgi:hypothetical protein
MRIKNTLESIAYVGLKPSGPGSKRTTERRKMRQRDRWIGIGMACVVLVTGGFVTISRLQKASAARSAVRSDIKEIKIAPVSLPVSHPPQLEVIELRLDYARPPSLIGAVRNNTHRAIAVGHLHFELDDAYGQTVGTEGADVKAVPAGGVIRFQLPVKAHDAAVAWVTEVTIE